MQSVVDRTGVPADTIRSWERRHGFPVPVRDANNQRLYSEHDIQAIQHLKEQTANGVALRDALRLLPRPSAASAGQDGSIAAPGPAEAPARLHPVGGAPVVDRLVVALQAFDCAAARSILHTELVTQPADTVAFATILPAAGRLRRGEGAPFGVAFLTRILHALLNAANPETGGQRVVLAAVTGCHDDLPQLAHGLALARHGFGPVLLGPAVDLAALHDAIRAIRPSAVILLADDDRTTATALDWWRLLADLPSIRRWSGVRAIASPERPVPNEEEGGSAPVWLPQSPDAPGILERGVRVSGSGTNDVATS